MRNRTYNGSVHICCNVFEEYTCLGMVVGLGFVKLRSWYSVVLGLNFPF